MRLWLAVWICALQFAGVAGWAQVLDCLCRQGADSASACGTCCPVTGEAPEVPLAGDFGDCPCALHAAADLEFVDVGLELARSSEAQLPLSSASLSAARPRDGPFTFRAAGESAYILHGRARLSRLESLLI